MKEELAPGIYFLQAGEKGFPYCHCLLIESELRAVIDTGAGEQVFNDLDPLSVDLVINTHYHKDHTFGNELFPNARILIHAFDAPPLLDKNCRDYYTGFFEWEKVFGRPREFLPHAGGHIPAPFEPSIIHGFITNSDTIDFGHTRATVFHTPGHTPGHCGFYFDKEGIFFGGDIDLVRFGPYYGDYVSNLEDFEKSIESIAELSLNIYCSGHRQPIYKDINEQIQQYKSVIYQREERLLQLLTSPSRIEDLTGKNVVYSEYFIDYQRFWERRMIEKHLEKLIKTQRVNLLENEYYQLAE
ncbi:MAG: MBL fold metallo-hydrolase [Chitinophagales bacterium]